MKTTDVARLISTWFGCGRFPVAPGTAGSLGAVLPACVLHTAIPFEGIEVALFGLLLFGPAVWAADVSAREAEAKDPGFIVVDEVVGQCITMAGASQLNWKTWLGGFLLFRTFDVWKPFPIRRLEKLSGGLGIVADDALAGVYAALVLFLIGWFYSY